MIRLPHVRWAYTLMEIFALLGFLSPFAIIIHIWRIRMARIRTVWQTVGKRLGLSFGEESIGKFVLEGTVEDRPIKIHIYRRYRVGSGTVRTYHYTIFEVQLQQEIDRVIDLGGRDLFPWYKFNKNVEELSEMEFRKRLDENLQDTGLSVSSLPGTFWKILREVMPTCDAFFAKKDTMVLTAHGFISDQAQLEQTIEQSLELATILEEDL